MRVKETEQQRHAFLASVMKWVGVEDAVIMQCDNLTSSTDNTLVKAFVDAVKADAVKHKEILAAIEQTLTGTIALTPEDMGAVSKLLDFVVDAEKPKLQMAAQEQSDGGNFVVHQLLSYILADEGKYISFRDEFNEFKKKIYPYGIS